MASHQTIYCIVMLLVLSSSMISCTGRGSKRGKQEENEHFKITKPRIIGEKITEILDNQRAKGQLSAYRELERKKAEKKFNDKMAAAVKDVDETVTKIMGNNLPNKKKRRRKRL